MVQFIWRQFNDLTTAELYEILALRQEVFILEQKICDEKEIDHCDQKAWHLMGLENGELVTYLRLFMPGDKYEDAVSFGRVLTKASARGKGYAKLSVLEMLDFLKQKNIHAPIEISAQAYLKDFYLNHGFKVTSEPYTEAGILHIGMRRESNDN